MGRRARRRIVVRGGPGRVRVPARRETAQRERRGALHARQRGGARDLSDAHDLGIPKLRAQAYQQPEYPDRICTNRASVALGPETGLKFGQAVPCRSKEWHQLYGTPRNTVEGGNSMVKDDAKAALASPGRRRARGYTLQLLYTACLLATTNLRRINSFLAKKPKPTNNTA